MSRFVYITLLLALFCQGLWGQQPVADGAPAARFFTPSDTLNKKRLWAVTGFEAGVYGGAMVGLASAWYSNYNKTHFHFFNDNKEWAQIDKLGHALVPYFAGQWSYSLYRWAGVPRKRALWGGAMSPAVFLLGIEILDGFSAKWGFSNGDVVANFSGSLAFITQELAWREQRILLKLSSHPKDYSYLPAEAQARAEYLSGTNLAEHVLKDYNSFTMWASVNPSSFMQDEKKWLPRWLNVAVGYGAENLLGGFSNSWCANTAVDLGECPHDQVINYDHIPRYRQYYLSLDIDFSRIRTKRKGWKALFGALNVLKVPFPTLEVRSNGFTKLHWIYF